MANINIKTTLGICPLPQKHEILVITRGATASINFDLYNKVYTMDYIDQATFTFNQGKNIFYYNMIEYYKLTTDTIARTGAVYYERLEANIPGKATYKFVAKAVDVGASVVGLYERSDLADAETTDNWQFDDHFYYYKGESYAYISFIFDSSETKMFTAGNDIEFEVTIRLDTDSAEGMHSKDSYIIDPQHPIAVVDSLYSKIGG